ncbi:MAG: hypothetical protein ABEH65_03945 [Halobacteriales archaeon]
MPLKASGWSTDIETVDRFDGGVGWIAHPDEALERASHALVIDDAVWIVDPIDGPGVDELITELGDVAGVVVLLDRHMRDAAVFADRYDVPVYLPTPIDRMPETNRIERITGSLPGTRYRTITVMDKPGWHEVALFDETTATLVVPEALGTIPSFRADPERIGVHPALRLFPPRVLRRYTPDRILVGHGSGVFEDATEALREAIDGSRRRAPRVYARNLRQLVA